mgnify:CR=1 FL=1
MQSLYKIWAAPEIQKKWNADIERFVASKKPQTHDDIEQAIKEYELIITRGKK